MAGGHGLATKFVLDGLLASGILGGDVQELPYHAWGLTFECMDEGLSSHNTDEGIDQVSIGDVGKLNVLLGEALDVLPKGLVSPLPIVAEVP